MLGVVGLLGMHRKTFLPVEPGQKKRSPTTGVGDRSEHAFSRSPLDRVRVVVVDWPGT